MSELETVKVVNHKNPEKKFRIINKSDFDADVHELYKPKKDADAPAPGGEGQGGEGGGKAPTVKTDKKPKK